MRYDDYIYKFSTRAHPELVEGSERASILQQVQDERGESTDKKYLRIAGYFLIMTCLTTSCLIYPFSYDTAIYAAQKGDMKRADEQLKKIVVDAPDSADILYDAGAVAHRLNNCSQAAAYFTRAATCAKNDNHLRVQAHFNAGNAHVDNKNLKEALAHYDEALAIKPDNEYARHNRNRVAQMLQEQEKQQDQQKDKNQKDDQKDTQDEQKNDQQFDDGNKQQQQNDGKNDQQQGNDQQGQKQKNNSSGNQSEQKSQGEQGDDSEQGDEGRQKKEHGDAQKNQQKSANNSANDKKRNGEQDFDKKSQRTQSDRKKQQGKQHEKTPDKQDGTNDKTNETSGDKQEQGKEGKQHGIVGTEQKDGSEQFGQKIDDPWLVSILNDQELRDKAINKQLMEAKVRQHGGKNGQNCW